MKSLKFLSIITSIMVLILCQNEVIALNSPNMNLSKYSNSCNYNFLVPRSKNVQYPKLAKFKYKYLDSLIFINDTCQFVVTSKLNNDKRQRKSTSKSKTHRDTVYNHALFSKKYALDSIKTVLINQYNFKNNIENTVYLGYRNTQPKVRNSIGSILVKETLVENGFINVTLDGVFMTDGACDANLIIGIEMYEITAKKWVLITDNFENIKYCGPSSITLYNQTSIYNIHELWRENQTVATQKFLPPETYRLVVKELPSNTFVYSNQFHFK